VNQGASASSQLSAPPGQTCPARLSTTKRDRLWPGPLRWGSPAAAPRSRVVQPLHRHRPPTPPAPASPQSLPPTRHTHPLSAEISLVETDERAVVVAVLLRCCRIRCCSRFADGLGRSVGRSVDRSVGWSIGWLVGWLVGRLGLAGRLAGWLVGCLAGCMVGWLVPNIVRFQVAGHRGSRQVVITKLPPGQKAAHFIYAGGRLSKTCEC
jgi:hypothetical protein